MRGSSYSIVFWLRGRMIVIRYPVDEVNVFFPVMLLTAVSHTASYPMSPFWLRLKLPDREADLSNLSNSEATYVCI